jgi:hypothetical protein
MSPLSQRRAAALQVFGEVRQLAKLKHKPPRPLALSDRQFALVRDAARAVPVNARDGFLQDVAARLADEPSDAAVMQAINSVFDRIPIFLA